MNFSVHTLMYSYFCAVSIDRRVMRFAPYVTTLQISQFAWGTVVNKDNLEEVSWQGTVAVAERLWSPTPADVAQAVRRAGRCR